LNLAYGHTYEDMTLNVLVGQIAFNKAEGAMPCCRVPFRVCGADVMDVVCDSSRRLTTSLSFLWRFPFLCGQLGLIAFQVDEAFHVIVFQAVGVSDWVE
jgi:hypothetical protein